MKVVLLGPPGAGKGTQAKLIINHYGIPHLSTGDVFRRNIAEGTDLGKQALEYINKGNLVPDGLTIAIVEELMKHDKCNIGFLMDGYPRTVKQAEALDRILEENNDTLNAVLLIDVKMEYILDRMTGRRVCEKCGASYHVEYNPPKQLNACNLCGGKLIQRKDDSEEVVRGRLEVYKNQTSPLIKYYEDRNELYRVDGTMPINDVFEAICNILGSDEK